MSDVILEIVHFTLRADADEEAFLRDADVVQEKFLKKQQGYVSRELVRTKDEWLDILHWESEAQAKAAEERFMQSEDCAAFIKHIDVSSTKMEHADIMKAYKE